MLFGDVDPSGKLPQTWPVSMSQLPTADTSRYPGTVDVSTNTTNYNYSEGLEVGYRWYDAKHLTPLFPFGYGLTYSTFSYSRLVVTPSVATQPGTVQVEATVTNTGTRSASDVAQLYVDFPAQAGEPPRQLKGFQRVTLQPGQSTRVMFTLTSTDLQTWDTNTHTWTITAGNYGIYVGDSSRNLPLAAHYILATTPGARTVAVNAPSSLDPDHPSTVTTTLTAGGTQTLRSVRPGLDVPDGWTARAVTPASFAIVPPSKMIQTTWSVTPAAGAQSRLWRLVGTATGDGGYASDGALQVTVGPLVRATLTTSTTLARTGTTFPAALTLNNATDHPVTVTPAIDPPAGVTVTPALQPVTLQARSRTTTPVQVTVGNSATSATLDVTGTVMTEDGTYPLQDSYLDLPLVFGSLADAYNNTGISNDADPASANFDGAGYSYSAQALANVGLTPGATVTSGSAQFTWPSADAGQPDNVVTSGQLIAVDKSGSHLSFLGAANNGNGSGTGTITYTDGSTEPFTLALTNWTPGTKLDADDLVATAPTWNRPAGSGYPANIAVSVYATTVPLDANKTVSYVTLPTSVTGTQAGTTLHVFDMVVY